MKMKHYEITTLFGHTLYLSYTKERLSQEVSRVAELFQGEIYHGNSIHSHLT